mmetsp:Transcript_97328/g.253667  ORF Transcript_97328/g.253667 Transcript_97328/m.253667 type:complete len:246 (+) Transcript_97328:82-819(+)
MARGLAAAVLMSLAFSLAGAVDSEASRPKGARRQAGEQEHRKAAVLEGAAGSEAGRPRGARGRAPERVRARASVLEVEGAVASEAGRPRGARGEAPERVHRKAAVPEGAVGSEGGGPRGALRKAHGHVHAGASLLEGAAGSEASRPKGARRRARERALAKTAADEVAAAGCVNLGGDKRFSDGHDETIQVLQRRCWITFSLSDGQMHRGLVRGYKVHVEPPFPDGEMLPNQTITFEDGKRWVRKF